MYLQQHAYPVTFWVSPGSDALLSTEEERSRIELQKLPAELENKIRQLTKGIVIVVGYRGQDIGIMNSLNTSDGEIL